MRGHGGRKKSAKCLIVGDGVSEKVYFESLVGKYRHISLIPVNSGKAGAYEQTIRKCKSLMGPRSYDIDVTNGDKVVIVTDVDSHTPEQIRSMKEKCDLENIEMHLTNICFEVFLLSHFRKIQRYYEKDELISELSEYLGRRYIKSIGIDPTVKMTRDAVINGRAMVYEFDTRIEESLDCSISRSTIHMLIDELEEYR